MLRLSDKSPGPSWAAIVPVSFNIYSSTNPDMITVYYYPKDATADPLGDDNFTSFKKQLISFNVLKNGVKSIDYIDDEDDVIHIDSEQEFMEAIKFAKAYKEKNGQSVFLLIDEKSEREANSENAKISTDDDKAELIEEESKVDVLTSQQNETVTQNDFKHNKYNCINKKSKSSKADDKSEPNACCKNYLEQFKQEIITEVTKNVLKKLSSALNSSEIDTEIKNEESRDKLYHHTPQLSYSHESSLGNHNFSPKNPALFGLTRHQGPFYPINPENKYDFRNGMIGGNYTIVKPPNYYCPPYWFPRSTNLAPTYLRPNNLAQQHIQYPPLVFPETVEGNHLTRSETAFGDELLRKAIKEDLESQHMAVISTPAEKKSSNDQKKKPKITNLVVLKRDDLTQEQKSLIDQFKKIKSKRPNVLEMKSTIKKIAAPSPKKSISSKIKNKSKIEKELALNAKMLSSLKLDSEEVQKTGGCKRKSHSTDENRPDKSYSCDDSLNSLIQNPSDAVTFETYEKLMRKRLDQERQFRVNFLKNMRIFPNSSVIPVKDEIKDAKDNVKETWSQDTNQSDGEVNDKIVHDQDEQSTSDDISTLSETSSLSGVSENNFELVYYNEETNNVDVKAKKRGSSSLDTKENSVTKNTSADSVKQDAGSVKNKPTKTEEGSKKSEDPKKEVRFDVVIEDIGPDNESEELIPELTKRQGGDYSYVRETLPKAKEAVAETSEATEKNTKKESDCNKQQSKPTSNIMGNPRTFWNTCSVPQSHINIKTFTDKKSQHNNPSYATTVPNVSSSCFVVHPSAPKSPKPEKKLRELEKSMKQTKKELQEAEKKLWAYHEKSSSKTPQDEHTPSNFSNPLPSSVPLCPTYATSASCSYSNDPKNNPDPFSYGYLHSRRHSNPTRMPPMYVPPPPPPFYPQNYAPQNFSSPGFDPYVPMTTLENIAPFAFQSSSASGFDPMKSFHENVASEAAAQAYAHARKAVDNYFNKQQSEKR
ncbi:uncharacterized protein DDB_G0284459-like isoform X1 [Cotesia glomerata]|uniref:uncharacterized protein DDB_G0284459-like isoform X1 n=1 Tax=Cotesia glomerata TaxID=32391 RepID=UPI001D032C00|nr:uncharacterized protein DDB_G0284459-like isoform X1 [Cotesia glomerata]